MVKKAEERRKHRRRDARKDVIPMYEMMQCVEGHKIIVSSIKTAPVNS